MSVQGKTRSRLSAKEAAEQLHAIGISCRSDSQQAVAEVIAIAQQLTGALGVVFLERDTEQRLAICPDFYCPANLTHLRSLMQHVMRLSNVAAAEETPQAGTTEADSELLVVAVPVYGNPAGVDALALAIGIESSTQARATIAYLIQVLTWVAAYTSFLRHPTAMGAASSESFDVGALRTAIAKSETEPSSQARYRLFADWMCQTLECEQVLFGFRTSDDGVCRVAGYSGHDTFDRRSDWISVAEEVINETLVLDGVDHQPDLQDTHAAEQLHRISGQHIVERHVLKDADGKAFGGILGLSPVRRTTPASHRCSPETLGLFSQLLLSARQTEPTWLDGLLGIKPSNPQSKPWYKRTWLWVGAGALALLMLIPMPLKIKTDCVLQPRKRRYVSVPYEGRLEEALIKPGDVVRSGQLLARMDGRDIEWEISTLTADLRRVDKQRDTALAGYETAQAQISKLEAKRLKLQIEELRQRLENLEVRSPVDGVVVSGDPEKLQGSRFAMGDTLLEVAPLAEMSVELEIPDEDISHVRVGQTVRYRLSSMSLKTFDGNIDFIQPRSELRKDQNVFVAQVLLSNPDDTLRPGMGGRAKIIGDRHLLGWNLFHKAWDNLVSWVSW